MPVGLVGVCMGEGRDSQQGESVKAVLTNAVRQSPPASGCSETFVYTAHNDCETMHYPRTWCTDFCLSIFGEKVGNTAESCLRKVDCSVQLFVIAKIPRTQYWVIFTFLSNCVIGTRRVSTDTLEVRRCDT